MPGTGPFAVRLRPDRPRAGIEPALPGAHPAEVRAEMGEVVEGIDGRGGIRPVSGKGDRVVGDRLPDRAGRSRDGQQAPRQQAPRQQGTTPSRLRLIRSAPSGGRRLSR